MTFDRARAAYAICDPEYIKATHWPHANQVKREMVRRCVVFVWILQSFTIMRLAAIVNSQCEQGETATGVILVAGKDCSIVDGFLCM